MFFDDCRWGDKAAVLRAIANDAGFARVHEPATGATGLHYASRGGYVEIVKALVEAGANVNARDLEGRTPLIFMADWCTRADVVSVLIASGADVDAANDDGATALSIAAACDHRPGHAWGNFSKLASCLLSARARHDLFSAVMTSDVTEMDRIVRTNPAAMRETRSFGYFPAGATALHTACDRGNAEAVELLVEHGSDMAALDARGRPPLYLAAHDSGTRKPGPSPKAVQALLDRGAPTNVHTAALLGELAILRPLLAADSNLSRASDAGGRTPLHLATWNGQLETARLLVNYDADVNAVDFRGTTAYVGGEIGDLLVEHGIILDIFQAIGRKDIALIRNIVAKNPDALVQTTRYGQTPLRKATEWLDGEPNEVVSCLLELGAPMDLWTASALGRLDDLQRILADAPSSVNRYDNVFTPLHCAVLAGQSKVIDLLLDHGAQIEATTIDLATPLIWAMWRGKHDIARQLISRGADPDALDNWADTPWVMNELNMVSKPGC